MKRLMSLAIATFIVGSAYAQVAYDFRAVVKNVNQRDNAVVVDGFAYYPRFVQTTVLYGYLVTECAYCGGENGDTALQPAPLSMLVVANRRDASDRVYTIPSSLKQVRVWNPTPKIQRRTWDAEGGLWIGFDTYWPNPSQAINWPDYPLGLQSDPYAPNAEFTVLLFGGQNRPYAAFDEYGMPLSYYWANTWMHAAGFGKAGYSSTVSESDPCGWTIPGSECAVLECLSGSIIGGLYLCVDVYESPFDRMLCNDGDIVGNAEMAPGNPATTDWISGSWSIKRNTRDFEGICDFDVMIDTAGKLINPSFVWSRPAN